ncbi:MAG: DNA repair protein RecN [Gammaproteobacteria bacterium]|nr:DNA repair protein RecN [Gammaproteobacteria bacterium]
MLQQLHIRNFAIIENLELDFKKGMTVITGETGAGKSIAIDALGLVLGDRADASFVKHGAKRSEIIASFDISSLPEVKHWLSEQELDDSLDGKNSDCILRRTVSSEGGSRAYINGRPVPLQQIKSLSENLIDIHSQHQHQSLLRQDTQRELLDNFGANQTILKNVSDAFQKWSDLNRKLKQLKANMAERSSRIDFLQFQINELRELGLVENEWETLEQEHKQLANAELIEQALNSSINLLNDDDKAISSQLTSVIQTLEPLAEFLPDIQNSIEALNSAAINIDETISDLRHQINDESFDNDHFSSLESRLSSLLDVSRKHHCKPQELIQIQQNLEDELTPLLNAEETLDNLQEKIEAARSEYESHAGNLSKKRIQAAKKLKKSSEVILKNLGMNCQFEAQLIAPDKLQPAKYGNEIILFSICTNPGTPLKPLGKIASGGELSRISLAIQVVTAQVTEIPSMVFDEVDVGIGGGIAEVVGKLLKELGTNKQIICITHQAQVAAKGDTHWLVEKHSNKKNVTTNIISLDTTEREIEIARMIGGLELTEATHQHAKEMLSKA